MNPRETPQWQQTVNAKRELRNAAIDRFVETHGISPEAATPPNAASDLTATDSIEEITQAILSRALTASQLCSAYISRAIKAHQLVPDSTMAPETRDNLADLSRQIGTLTEILFHDAIKRANELDDYFQRTGRMVGPLHGVPMTLKDQFDVEGYDSTLGYVGLAFKPASQDCVLVSLLRQMGAVIIAKSNLSQSIMWCETENPLWGLTVHPQNADFTPGGSTGGEGALLALRGTVVGWGTDIGGSIRIPAHMNGVYGLKPSSTRLPYFGVSVSTEGQEHVPSVIGPMSQDMSSLVAVTKAVLDAKPYDQDPRCCPLPWRSGLFLEARTRPLVIAVMRDDGVVRPHPPVARVLEEVTATLERAGHEIIEWSPGKLHQECIDIMDQFYTADGGEDIRRVITAGGEPFLPHVEALVNRGQAISVYEYWQLNKQKQWAQKRYLDLWNATKTAEGKQIDVLLTPVMPHSAVPHRKCNWVGYTKVFNFVDYPAVVIPAGRVNKELDQRAVDDMASYQPRNTLDEWNLKNLDVDAMNGTPIGVQIVARRLQEEKALGAAKTIDELLRGI